MERIKNHKWMTVICVLLVLEIVVFSATIFVDIVTKRVVNQLSNQRQAPVQLQQVDTVTFGASPRWEQQWEQDRTNQ